MELPLWPESSELPELLFPHGTWNLVVQNVDALSVAAADESSRTTLRTVSRVMYWCSQCPCCPSECCQVGPRLCSREYIVSSSRSSSWRKAFSRSIPPLQFVAKMICLLPAPEHRLPVFPCPGRSDESRWWEVDLEHTSSRVMARHNLELHSRSEGSGLLRHHQQVWQRDQIIQAFVCGR